MSSVKRLDTPKKGYFPKGLNPKEMSYWKRYDGTWCMHFPEYRIGDLSQHDVIEHKDGTITVSPSILLTSGVRVQRHGFLRKGVWHPCSDDNQ